LSDLRIEAIGFPDHYCPVYRRDGSPDIMLDGPDGRPRRFTSAFAAINAAKLELVVSPRAADPVPDIGSDRWHLDRAAEAAAEQIEALGGIVVSGRIIPVERRRR
jgi:hypothetical protein